MDLFIIPECYIDTNLIETIAPPKKGYNHQKGCGTVAKVMQEKLADNFAVGIIDKDKKEIKYVEKFDTVISFTGLELLRHKDIKTNHFLIFIKPAIEKWILNNAKEVGILLTDFNYPTDLKAFCKITKRKHSKKDSNLKKLFNELLKRKATEVIILSKWIKYLKKENINVDLEKLKKIS